MKNGRTRVLLFTSLIFLLLLPIATSWADDVNLPHKTDELIIKFKANTPQSQKDAILADLGATQIKHFKRIKSDQKRITGLSVGNAIGRYKNHSAIDFIEPNYILEAVEIPNDPRFVDLWGMYNIGQTGGTEGADIDATIAWDVFTGSHDIVVGVIDTGVDYNHPDLAANIYTNPGEIPDNGIDDDGNGYIDDVHGWDFINNDNDPMDDNGHGTHCSGTIGGVGNNGIGVAGVSWNVSIMPLKFLDAGGSGSTTDALTAIEYATMMGINLTSNSWGGGGYSEAMNLAIADAGANNILFVAAAGNSGSNNDSNPHYPSSYDLDNVVAVAATDHNDDLASFSCYGAVSVDIAAPGADILSTLPGNSYGSLSGTSMATPHVSGALALIMGRFPAIDVLDAKALLLNFADPLPDLDGVVLSGARLNVFWPIAEPDSIPPGQITDLAVVTEGSNWVDTQWTAVGDDDYTGKASRYDLRYATFPITDANFETAIRVNGTPKPGDPGTLEEMRITGLDFTTTYYVAIKALDEFGNEGLLSPLAMGTTLGAPDISVNPMSLADALLTGGTSLQTLTLSNVGSGTLDFVIPSPTLLGSPVVVQESVEIPKGGVDYREGAPVALGTGGPDNFGYRWADSNDPFGPTFAWMDISGIGNVAMSSGDDETVGPFAIGFNFPFYGGDFAEFFVCSNGFVSLTDNSNAYNNQPLPSGGAPDHLIAPFWDDLTVDAGTIYYYNDGSRLIVQWEGVSHYQSGGPYSFQALIYPDGTIEYQYNTMGAPTGECTVGVQNGNGTDGLQVAFNTAYVTDGLAVQIRAIPQWVTVAPVDGTVWAPGSADLDVTFDATGLMGGTYDGIIRVISNDPDEGEYEVPVTLVVTGAPDISVEPLVYEYGGLFLGASASTTIMIRNIGTDVLNISAITIGDPVNFSIDVASAILPAGGSQPVIVTFAPTMAQDYSTLLTIASDDPTDPVVTVDLGGTGLEPPDFDVTPTSLVSNLWTGETESQELLLTNSGGSDFEFDLSIDFHADVTVHEYVEVGKENIDARVGDPVLLGSGGPDIYGYRWIDSDEPGGPTYSFTDISATGAPVFSGTADDTNEGPFPIGFNFSFYGNTFTEFNVCSNGWVSFTSTSTSYSNQELPNSGSSVPENLLAPFWDDLRIDTSTGANVFYEYDGSRLIIQFHRVPAYYTTGEHTFQVILYPDGTILYQYETMDSTDLQLCTVGMQNETKDDGLTVAFNTPYVKDGLAVRFQAFPEWLAVAPLSGTVPPGGSMPVTANFNATGMFGGQYQADIVIESNDPAVPTLPIPATLNVTGAPDMVVTPETFDFGVNFVGTPTLQNLVITNIGTDQLIVTGVQLDNSDFSTSLGPIELGPTETLIATVGFNPSAVGTSDGVLTIESNDPTSPLLEVPLTGVGVLPPLASVDPTSLVSDLFTGESETQTVTLFNTGDSDLIYTANTMLGAASVEVHADLVLAKEEIDPRPGILGSGGPDVYGYRWTDSDESGGPMFEWTDISTTGTSVFSGVADDTNVGPFEIGFAFPFYGTPFTDFRVSSNGFISFTSTSSDYSNGALPGTSAPENLLAMFHDDLRVDTNAGSNVYYQNVGNKLIVQFDQVPKYYTNGALTFQAHLYPNGAIYYYYLTMTDADLNSATVGIQNATRDDGLTVVYNDDYMHDNLAIRLAPVSDWLTVNPTAGTVSPGGSQPMDVVFSAAGMFGGVYDGAVQISTNDPLHGLIEVPATMTVTGVPVMAVDPASLDFGETFIGFDSQLMLTVSNVGTDVLYVTDIISGMGDFTAVPASFDLDPFGSMMVTVTFAPTAEGVRATDLQLVSNDANSPMMVPVTGIGVVPPDIAWSPDPVVGAAMPGGQKVKTLQVCNEGGSDLILSVNASESLASDMVQYPYVAVGKDKEDTRPGILGNGGPDTFGHTWVDSDDPDGPAFAWTDISTTGTAIFEAYDDDGNEGPLPIGFDFDFYGNTFNEFNVCSNGWLSFTSTSTSYSNQPLPNSGAPENMIAPFWDDMVVDAITRGLDVYYQYDGEKLVVQYDIRRIATYDPPWYSFQVLLYPNGNIMFQYNTLGTTRDSATIGIQNATGDDGLMMVFNDDYVHEGMAILISSAPSWLTAAPETAVIPAGECMDVMVTMNAAALEAGDYTGTITLTSNDPDEGTVLVDVIFHVGTIDAADSDIDPDTLNLASNGKWMTSYVELPVGYDPADVVIETVLFNGVVSADLKVFAYDEDFNGNGIPDLMFKFDRSEIEGILMEGEEVVITVTGEVLDTTYFVATDIIRVIQPTMKSPNGGEIVTLGNPYELIWENPDNWNVDHSNLYYTIDDGENWVEIATDVSGTSYTWIAPDTPSDEVRVRVFVYDNQGFLGYDSSDDLFMLMDEASAVDNSIPLAYGLAQNFPNPFNPQTEIRFELPHASNTKLSVYDLRGRLIKDLVSGHMDAGRHSVLWMGRDNGGRQVASGVYYYKITSGKFTDTRRMTLVK
ncbi:MAG: S8 family serine peptidase [Candidatus Krumholzibacteria bacterium]|nr:S8 family serine peptidase [Candidatus Krumholzibacteria bacterium]